MAEPAAEEIVLAEAALNRALTRLCHLLHLDPDEIRRHLVEMIERDTAQLRAQALGAGEPLTAAQRRVVGEWFTYHHGFPVDEMSLADLDRRLEADRG